MSSSILPGPRFNDVIGLKDAKRALREALLLPSLFSPKELVGIRSVSSCILLFGPPGTGKTVLAEAAAFESKRPLFRVSPSSVLSRFVGESEKNLLQIFQDASLTTPQGLIFFDEIDALAPRRDGGSGGDLDIAARRLLNELLLLLSAMPTRFPGVVVVAATNRCEDIDAALLRRFSVCIYCAQPSFKDRISLIKSLLQDISYDITASELNKISEETARWSGSDVKALTVEAAMAPLRDVLSDGKKRKVTRRDADDDFGLRGAQLVEKGAGKKRGREEEKEVIEENEEEEEEDEEEEEGEEEWLPHSWNLNQHKIIRAVTALDFEAALKVCFPSSRHHEQQYDQQQQQQHDQQHHHEQQHDQQHNQQQQHHFSMIDPDSIYMSSSSTSNNFVWTTSDEDTSLLTHDPTEGRLDNDRDRDNREDLIEGQEENTDR
jgi:SpoVK/Ycf46/Vps4 family AAA+-type ATPase